MGYLLKKWALWVGIGALVVVGLIVWRWRSAAAKVKVLKESLRQSVEREKIRAEAIKRARDYEAEQDRLKAEHDLRALEAKRRIEEIHAKHDAEVLAQAASEKKAIETGTAADMVLARRKKREERRERFR